MIYLFRKTLYIVICIIVCTNTNAQNDPNNIDVKFFRSINNSRSDIQTSIANAVGYSVYPTAAGLPLGLITYGIISDQQYEEDSGFLLAASEIFSIAIYMPMKQIFKRQRPYNQLENVHTGHFWTGSSYSFPSGHSTIAANIATLLFLRYPKPIVYIPLFTWAVVAGYSRVYHGLHYPSDVIAGKMIGIGSGLLIYHCGKKLIEIKRKTLGKKVDIFLFSADYGVTANVKIKF